MQLQLRYTNCTAPELQLHDTTTTTTAALHHTTSSSCGWGDRPGDHCNHCNNSQNTIPTTFSVHQWIRSAIPDSQQPTSPIGFLVWNFRHRLVRYYWYTDVVTQANSCMNSGGGHAFRAARDEQANIKPQFHRSFWRSRRISCKRVGPSQAHVAISFQVLAIDISCEGVAFRGHQSTPPCRPKRKFRKTFEPVGVFTVRSWPPPASS